MRIDPRSDIRVIISKSNGQIPFAINWTELDLVLHGVPVVVSSNLTAPTNRSATSPEAKVEVATQEPFSRDFAASSARGRRLRLRQFPRIAEMLSTLLKLPGVEVGRNLLAHNLQSIRRIEVQRMGGVVPKI